MLCWIRIASISSINVRCRYHNVYFLSCHVSNHVCSPLFFCFVSLLPFASFYLVTVGVDDGDGRRKRRCFSPSCLPFWAFGGSFSATFDWWVLPILHNIYIFIYVYVQYHGYACTTHRSVLAALAQYRFHKKGTVFTTTHFFFLMFLYEHYWWTT